MSTSPGSKPFLGPDGRPMGPVTRNIMDDERYQPSLRELLHLGVGKAHRSVTYAHFEFRNYKRSHLGTQGRLS